MKVEIKLNNGKVVIKENNNLVDALTEFDAKEFRGYTLKTTGKYNNRTGEFVS